MISVTVGNNYVAFGEHFSLVFLRTLRVPDDGKVYPLPPGFGEFTLHRDADEVLLCMYQREALWLGFDAPPWHPYAVMIGAGHINALTGELWNETLSSNPQNYLVCPPQPWLDGFHTSDGVVRQFVAAPLGRGLTVESQLATEEAGGLQVIVFEPHKGIFPDSPPPRAAPNFQTEQVQPAELGLAAGGEITQNIYEDPYGLQTWDTENFGRIRVRILNSAEYTLLTGTEPPPTPINAATYIQCGFPWYKIYDEHLSTVTPTDRLSAIKSLDETEATHSSNQPDNDARD